ncbi:MAG: hypothetical protein MI975_06820 [Cytophagales bacterium]|nr:hypothetical protein [Cytophagales bacterium]
MSDSREKIIVTQPEFDKGHRVFSVSDRYEYILSDGEEASLTRAIIQHEARYAIVGIIPYTKTLYEALPKAGLIARFGVGHDNIDKELATSKDIFCTNTPEVLNDSVAEHTVALLMEISRKAGVMNHLLKHGKWYIEPGFELKDKKIAILGCGRIGRKVASILHNGFGMRVVGYDEQLNLINTGAKLDLFTEVSSSLEDMLSDIDFLSVHIPASKENMHFINDQVFGLIPEKAWLINTSRGVVLDELALFEALKSGSLAGAALDVFENEPYKPVAENADLRTLSNVIMTPHVGSSTKEANDRMAEVCLKNIGHAMCGEYHKMDLINTEIVSKYIYNEGITEEETEK